MGERQITVGAVDNQLPSLVHGSWATQNPIEQGAPTRCPKRTRLVSCARVSLTYPDAAGEHAILELNRNDQRRSATDAALFNGARVG